MFTGLVQEVGTITSMTQHNGSLRMGISTPFAAQCDHGESIATSGVCLTVIDHDERAFYVDIMPETMRMSSLADKTVGDSVNLERSLRLGDRLGGHLVQGHVDATGVIRSVEPGPTWTDVCVNIPESISGFIAGKGSICVDGVSLTVTDVGDDYFCVSLIPETLRATTLGELKQGQRVNVETDMLARYIQRMATRGLLDEHKTSGAAAFHALTPSQESADSLRGDRSHDC